MRQSDQFLQSCIFFKFFCTGINWYIPVYTSIYWYIQVRTSTYLYVLVHTILHYLVPCYCTGFWFGGCPESSKSCTNKSPFIQTYTNINLLVWFRPSVSLSKRIVMYSLVLLYIHGYTCMYSSTSDHGISRFSQKAIHMDETRQVCICLYEGGLIGTRLGGQRTST